MFDTKFLGNILNKSKVRQGVPLPPLKITKKPGLYRVKKKSDI